MDTPSAPPTPGRSEIAVPVAGGWVTVCVDSAFTPADEMVTGQVARSAAAFVRRLDPQQIRDSATQRLVSLASDPFTAARDVIADMLEAP